LSPEQALSEWLAGAGHDIWNCISSSEKKEMERRRSSSSLDKLGMRGVLLFLMLGPPKRDKLISRQAQDEQRHTALILSSSKDECRRAVVSLSS
jgi:hypothetical protein